MTTEISVRLPVLTPVTAHAHPIRLCAFDPHFLNITCTCYIADQNQIEVTKTVDCEPYSSCLPTRDPAIRDGDDAGTILSDLKKHGHGEIEVSTRRVTPTTIVVW